MSAESEQIVRLEKALEDVKLAAEKALEEVKLAAAKDINDANTRAAAAEKRAADTMSAFLAAVPPPAPPRRLPKQLSLIEGLSFRVVSPSKGNGILLQSNLVSFTMNAEPHLDSLRGLTSASSLQSLSDNSPASLLSEENLYELATKFTPEWVKATSKSSSPKGAKTARTLFCEGATPPDLPNFKALPWGCMPELLTSSRNFHPGFNGEVKSAISRGESSPKMFDELLTYVFLGTAASLFANVPAGHRRFFSYPPVGFGLAAFPHVGYLVAVEWIGKLFVSVVSQPFFLGSPEHEAAIVALPDRDYRGDVVDLNLGDVRVMSWSATESAGLAGTAPDSAALPPSVLWSDESSRGPEGSHIFFKIVLCSAYEPVFFERMFEAYGSLAEAFDKDKVSDPPPASLVPARLLFGAGEVCVTMPWVGGRDAVEADLAKDGCAVQPVAEAVAWLARRGLVYVDLRPPNVRIEEEWEEKEAGAAGAGSAAEATSRRRVVLIDYDDLKVATTTQGSGSGSKRRPCSFSALMAELADADAPWAKRSQPGGLPAVLDAVEALLGGP